MKGQNDKRRRTFQIISLFFNILLICCLAWLTAYFIGLKRASDEMDAIRQTYISEGGISGEGTDRDAVGGSGGSGDPAKGGDSAGDDSGSAGPADAGESAEDSGETASLVTDDLSPYGVTDRSIDWALLQEEKNKDIYAWIMIPGTAIDYPVLQHPEEMDYYLQHNLDGSKGRPGCIYTQRMNSRDWSDRNTVLYGHNMRVGTMFAGLHEFEDTEFFEENQYIHIYSEDGRILIYEIFAAYAFSDAHILMTYDFYSDEGYQQYLDTVRESAEESGHFRRETELSTEDKIITLSTCVRDNSSQRYLVQGVLVAEGEQP